MRNVSAGFLTALQDGGIMLSRIQVVSFNPASGTDRILADSWEEDGPEITGGSLKVDSTNPVRRYLESLTIVDPNQSWIPRYANSVFSSFTGNEIKLWLGFQINGQPEMLEQGYFDISEPETTDDFNGTILTVTGYDRARRVERASLTAPLAIPNNTNGIEAVKIMISAAIPGVTFVTVPTNFTIPYQLLDEGSFLMTEATATAASFGYEVFFDVWGQCVIRPIPTLDNPDRGSPVYNLSDGESSTILKLSRQSPNQDVPNGIVVTGANTYNITPPRAEVWDDDPSSPTYYLGPYGKVAKNIQSDKVSTNAQATEMAKAELRKVLGGAEQITADIVPNCALEPEDIIHATRAKIFLDNDLILESYDLPINASDGAKMGITTRQRRLAG